MSEEILSTSVVSYSPVKVETDIWDKCVEVSGLTLSQVRQLGQMFWAGQRVKDVRKRTGISKRKILRVAKTLAAYWNFSMNGILY